MYLNLAAVAARFLQQYLLHKLLTTQVHGLQPLRQHGVARHQVQLPACGLHLARYFKVLAQLRQVGRHHGKQHGVDGAQHRFILGLHLHGDAAVCSTREQAVGLDDQGRSKRLAYLPGNALATRHHKVARGLQRLLEALHRFALRKLPAHHGCIQHPLAHLCQQGLRRTCFSFRSCLR